ncbi:hypothetical protein PICMEDRAFT_15645 [Pichia membranifaciens NRRL Y-2026]|uniref:Uncharacterized protein n=1 Tax=Pichia membranifaciens NRRL Y-2026 TaxID=763406 RepID=A0A1E3NNR6_9ASCO|nr:hypothetical protein PICMEDRAFT_15645 [Pichia membranifaciens NRRL Y-2026]ODQ47735.1 hypothetical protein PICMEDRAFT_15645 [Pichia membranifaciens NRRL Y-2026]
MSIIVNNNLSLAEKDDHVKVYDREHRVSVTEATADVHGLGLSKVISYIDDDDKSDDDEYYDGNNYSFIPTVSCDNYDSVHVYGHNQM